MARRRLGRFFEYATQRESATTCIILSKRIRVGIRIDLLAVPFATVTSKDFYDYPEARFAFRLRPCESGKNADDGNAMAGEQSRLTISDHELICHCI